MKNCLITVMLLATVVLAGAITREDAYTKITDNMLSGDLDGRSILALNHVVPAGSNVADMHGQTFRAPSTSYFFLVDDHFLANWDHPCRYVFVDTMSGDMTVFPANAPIRNSIELDTLFISPVADGMTRYNSYSLPVLQTKEMVEASKKITLGNNPIGQNYAIMLSGGYDMSNNWSRYYGDIKWQLRALKEKYGYTNDHIFIAMSDGTNPAADQHVATGYINSDNDIDQDGQQEVHYAATIADFNTLVNDIKAVTTSSDNLHLFITDHGGGSGTGSYINLWAGATMSYQTLKSLIDTIPHGYLSACNEVCEAGGLILGFSGATNAALATACTAYQSSYARSGHPYDYDEFTFWWTGAVYGTTAPPENIDCSAADVNQDGYVSMQEAFTFAQTHDAMSEQPQWYENPDGFGDDLYLGGLIGGGTGVQIASFNTSGAVDRVTLAWTASGTESLAGFNIYRALPGKDQRYERINSRPIIGVSPFRYDDLTVERNQKYMYCLEAVDTSGFKSQVGPVSGRTNAGIPTNFSLGIRPNPAHGQATLDYSIASTFGNTDTRLAILDISGRTVKVLVNGPVAPGMYNLQWDGTDAVGREVSAGVYICTLSAGGQHLTKRIVFAH